MHSLQEAGLGRWLSGFFGVWLAALPLGCGGDGGPGGNGGNGSNGHLPFRIVRVSVDDAGQEGVGASWEPAVSADGRYVAFTSGGPLVPEDTNMQEDVYVHDLEAGTTRLVSVDSDGNQAEGGFTGSEHPSISSDGRYVAFTSTQHLVHDTAYRQVYLRDRQEGTTHLVSLDGDGEPAEGGVGSTAVSADGRSVAYASSWDMIAGEEHPGGFMEQHIYVHDRQTGLATRASASSDGEMAEAPDAPFQASFHPTLSADGRYVAYSSNADNLVPGITNERDDVFLHDQQTGETTRVSVTADGQEGEGSSGDPAISANGRYVAFTSVSNLIDEGGSHVFGRIYLRDLQEGTVERIGDSTADNASQPSISADGRYLAFTVNTGGVRVVYWHDRETGALQRISETASGQRPNGESMAPSISADGRTVAFDSHASDLVEGDTNDQRDVFVAIMQ